MPLIESFSGIRGIYDDGLNEKVTARYTYSYISLLNNKFKNKKLKIVIGTDTRHSKDILKNTIFEVLNCDIIDLGIASTPMIEFAVKHFKTDGGIIITASHNEPYWNGFKFLDKDGAVLRPKDMEKVIKKYNKIKKLNDENLPDRELINAPIKSELGQKYYNAMCASVNFAFTNRQMIAHWTRDVFKKVFGTSDGMNQVYDVCHNLAKFEKHEIDNKQVEVCVHRKGATRSFGPGRTEVPEVYRNIGQPVIIPGSMGTASYLLVGTKKAEEISFGSTAHGAGRVGSRAQALRTLRGERVARDLANKGIEVKGPWKGLAEEAPQMYKDIDEVVNVSHKLGIGNLVARLVPLAVMKG